MSLSTHGHNLRGSNVNETPHLAPSAQSPSFYLALQHAISVGDLKVAAHQLDKVSQNSARDMRQKEKALDP